MLVNSGVRYGGGPLRSYGGVTAGSQERAKWEQPGNLRNRYVGDAAIPLTSGLPVGYLHPRSWSMPMKPGGMSARALEGTSTVAALAESGTLMYAGLTGDAVITADMYGAFSTSASLTGSGNLLVVLSGTGSMDSSITSAGALAALMQAAAVASAALSGTGTVAGTAGLVINVAAGLQGTSAVSADMLAGASAAASLTGAGSVGSSLVGVFAMDGTLTALGTLAGVMGGQAYLDASLLGQGVLNAIPYSLGGMEAHISNAGEALNPDTVAAAVWAHISALELIQTADDTLAAVLAGGGTITIGDVQTAMTLQGYSQSRAMYLDQLDSERQGSAVQILAQLKAACSALEEAISKTIPLPYAAYAPRPVVGPPSELPAPVEAPTPSPAVSAPTNAGLPANTRFLPKQPLLGVRDGVNKVFTSVVAFVSDDAVREVVYRSGVRVPITDYRVNTAARSITFLRAPLPTDTLFLDAYVETAA